MANIEDELKKLEAVTQDRVDAVNKAAKALFGEDNHMSAALDAIEVERFGDTEAGLTHEQRMVRLLVRGYGQEKDDAKTFHLTEQKARECGIAEVYLRAMKSMAEAHDECAEKIKRIFDALQPTIGDSK